MNRHKKFNKFLATFLSLTLLTVQGMYPLYAIAETSPDAPGAPTPPPEPTIAVTETVTPTPLPEPTEPAAPDAPEAPQAPTPPPEPTLSTVTNPDPLPIPQSDDEDDSSQNGSGANSGSTESPTEDESVPLSSSATVDGTGGNSQDGQSGSTSIITGDADNVGNISTTANTNISAGPSSGSLPGLTVGNTGNGSESDNSSSANISGTTNNLQTNLANVGNNLYQKTVTGDNSASKNTGGDQNIQTGDANTTGTIVTGVNTNLDGLSVYEFNIADDQNGNYVLDFNPNTCISGCGGGDVNVGNTANGAGSVNDANADLTGADNTFQLNDANVENNMTLISDSGDNKANFNTGGDSTIESGDANVSGNILNMVNNNIAGDVVYAVVNIFGNLVGDIVLPDTALLGCCASDTTAQNSGNGTDSTNTANVDQTNSTNTTQFNNADIQNNLVLDADTGNNDVNKNTDGTGSVTTGDANILAQVLNVANVNLIGGNMWLVLVNEAGRWIGRIIGADGSNYAASPDLEFIVDENGEITVVNAGNGTGSTNNSTVSQDTTTNIEQTNNASIVNNVHLEANTGDNNTNYNTGGNNSVSTGDANIVANIVNFVNNNIVGAGRLFVTVINVFGSWVGNFVGPGQESNPNPTADNQPGIGGSSNTQSNDSQDNSETSVTQTSLNTQQPAQNQNNANVRVGIAKLTNVLASASFSDESVASNNASEGVKGETAGKKVVKVNLAYLLLVIPAAVAFAVIRRKRLLSKVFAAGKQNA